MLANLHGQFVSNQNLIAAAALIAAVPTLIIYVLLQKQFMPGSLWAPARAEPTTGVIHACGRSRAARPPVPGDDDGSDADLGDRLMCPYSQVPVLVAN